MRILIVEDEHKIANSIKKGLEQESYAVDISFDGKEGYDLLSTEEYDVAIVDRMLPEMDGLTLCKQLREQAIHTPLLLLTAKGQVSDRVEVLNVGADDYLVKPFAFTELLARVKALIRRPKKTTATILQVADLEMNTVTYEVTRNKKAITLSNKEYALLEYLMRHPNQIISKEQIINHIWNYDADVLPNSVEVYVTHLRNKIDKPFAHNELIHTVRGFGYKISP